jgi:hypothetical protein
MVLSRPREKKGEVHRGVASASNVSTRHFLGAHVRPLKPYRDTWIRG